MARKQGADQASGTPGRRRRTGALALAIAALGGVAVTTLALTGGTATTAERVALSSPAMGADLAMDAPEVVLVRAEGDTRWRGELVMTVRVKSGSPAEPRRHRASTPGIQVWSCLELGSFGVWEAAHPDERSAQLKPAR
jgi:hypothetical protein